MNVTEMARYLRVSKPTLYKRVKDNGLTLDELRDRATGEITAHGAAVLADLFANKTPLPAERKPARITPLEAEMKVLQGELDGLKGENALLRKALEDKDRQIEMLTADLEAWRAKAQEIDVRQLLLLTEPRRGVLARIRNAFSKKGEGNG